jgi:hypothetical protein
MDVTSVEAESMVRAVSRLPDPALLDRVVTELCEIERRSGIDRTLAIGELILTRFFDSDASVWRDRRRNKNNSIRRIADRKDCPYCKSALNEAVAVYVAALELPCVRTFGHIRASHLASVLKLPSEQRRSMLEDAERERWSVRELRQRVVVKRQLQGERRGRPRRDAETRTLSTLCGIVRQLEAAVDNISGVGPLTPGSRSELRELGRDLGRVASALDALGVVGPNVTSARSTSELGLRKRSA